MPDLQEAPSPPLGTRLDDEQKRAFDALDVIRSSYYKCFSDRRDFEWKMSISIWTAVAIYTSALVVGKDAIMVEPQRLAWGTAAGALVLVLVHAIWLLGTAKANDLDKAQAFESTDAMRRIVGMEWSPDLAKRIKAARDDAHKSRLRWSQVTQLAVTVLLGTAASVAAVFRGAA